MRSALLGLGAALCWALAPAQARAAPADEPPPPAAAPAPPILSQVGITERLGERLPADVALTRADGSTVRFGELVGRGRPVVLTLVYYECPMLCGLLLGGLTTGLKESGLALGRDYDAVTLSFDPRETPALAASRQQRYLQALDRPAQRSDWNFLVGRDPAIHAVADAVGFRYAYDGKSRTYAHAAAVIVLMPDGRISRYLYGVQFEPRDLRLAVLEAGGGRVGTALQRALLTCYRWDPASRRYAFFVSAWLRAGGLAIFLGLGGLILRLALRERRARARAA